MEIAPVLEIAVGFEQGAKTANPDVRIVLAVSDNVADPAKSKEIALAQMADGADVIFTSVEKKVGQPLFDVLSQTVAGTTP